MHIIISDLDDEQKDLKSVYLPEDWLQHQDFSKSHVNRSKDILKHLLLIGEIDCDSEVVQNSGLASMLNNQLNGKKWWLDQNFDEKNIVQYLFNLCGDQKIMKGGKSIQEYCIEKQWQPPLLDIKKEYGFNKDAETVINELIGVIENPQKREALVRRICKLVEQDSAFVKTNGADSKSDLKEQSALLYNRCMAILPSSKRHLFEALDEEISKKMGERNDGYVMKYFVQILDFIKDFLIDKKIKQDVEANKGFVKKVLDSRNNQANLQKQ